ncbi:MAG TPA: MAPEG family protein [Steroidobacteraceae bacterium]|nr:MAPEG family protein [Steroidobacteraceae bacterium]
MPAGLPFMLALCILLGLLHILLAATLCTAGRGLKWTLGPRDGEPPPQPVTAGRAQRAAANFLETFPFFAAALVCAIATGHGGARAALGVQLYFWGRVAYLPLYLLGVQLLRSLAWGVSLVGLLMVVAAII